MERSVEEFEADGGGEAESVENLPGTSQEKTHAVKEREAPPTGPLAAELIMIDILAQQVL